MFVMPYLYMPFGIIRWEWAKKLPFGVNHCKRVNHLAKLDPEPNMKLVWTLFVSKHLIHAK